MYGGLPKKRAFLSRIAVASMLETSGKQPEMLQNYFKTTLRILSRRRGSFLFNITGLTLGISASVILFLLVDFQTSFDKFNTHFERIYRVTTVSDGGTGKDYQPGVPAVLPGALAEEFPEAEKITFASYRSGATILIPKADGTYKKFEESKGVVFAQPSFFDLFDRVTVEGDPQKTLTSPNQAVISTSLADKYFRGQDPVGKVIRYDTLDFVVGAVIADYADNTDFPFNLMFSQVTIARAQEDEGWGSIWSDNQCYFLLKEGADIRQLETRMPDFVTKYLGDDNWDHQTFLFQPVSDLHFDTRFSNYNYSSVSMGVIAMLSVIGIFLIITACINFINLTTAEAIKRSKEVGIRKTLGGSKSQLVRQFLGETAIVTFLAMVISLGVVQVSLQVLNPFLHQSLSLDLAGDMNLVLYLAGVFVVVSLLSGLYPAFTLSGYNPVTALKNQMHNKKSSGFWMRKSLVAFQFIISQFFIFGTIVLIAQMRYFQHKDLGFAQDAVINIPVPGQADDQKKKTLAIELERIQGVEQVSLSSTPPSSGSTSSTSFTVDGIDQNFSTQVKQVDADYAKLYQLELLAGTVLPPSDTPVAHVVNEKLVKLVGFKHPEEIIGRNLTMWGRTLPVVGVVKDFHATSLRREIEPIVLRSEIGGYHTASIKVNSPDVARMVDEIKQTWESFFPESVFDYSFLDERIKQFYEGEQRMSVLLGIFTTLAIFIGCLGLFGLATYMINQKTKEIGVRKVLGATVSGIMLIFSREYVRLVLIGFAVAAPWSWYVMNSWLNTFAYKITIGWWVFALGVFTTFLIAMVTVGYRSYRAAARNPINSLRYE